MAELRPGRSDHAPSRILRLSDAQPAGHGAVYPAAVDQRGVPVTVLATAGHRGAVGNLLDELPDRGAEL